MPLYRVTTRFDGLPGAPYFNTLFFDETAGSEQQAADAVGAFWGAVDSNLDDSLTWQTEPEVPTIDETDGSIQFLIVTTPSSGTGADPSEQGPTVLQGLVQWRTGVPVDGRILRGRTFIPGLTVAKQVDGEWDPTSAGAIQTAATALIESLNAGLSIWHRPRPEEDPPNPDKPARLGSQADVTGATVPLKFAVLRSRRD